MDIALIARALPFALYISLLALKSTLQPLLVSAGLPEISYYALMIAGVTLSLLLFRKHYTELTLPTFNAATLIRAVFIGFLIFGLWILPYPSWATLGGNGGAGFIPKDAAGHVDIGLAVLRMAGTALLVPVMEELFWRSFIARWIDNPNFLAVDPSRISHKALWMSSGLFAMEHSLWLAGLLAGLAYCWLYHKERSLWPPIIAHAITNGVLGVWILSTGAWQYW